MMRSSFGFQQEEFSVHEESWNFASEQHYSHGSNLQMMPRPCPQKSSSKHHMMFKHDSNFDNMHQQDKFHGHKTHQNGWHGSNGHYDNNLSGGCFNNASGGFKKKPVCPVNDSQFMENGMLGEFRNGAFASVRCPSKAVRVEEARYDDCEKSNWGTTDFGHCQSFENNFNRERLNGCRNF